MRTLLPRFRDLYESHPLNLLTMLAGLALAGYILTILQTRDAVEPTGVVTLDRSVVCSRDRLPRPGAVLDVCGASTSHTNAAH